MKNRKIIQIIGLIVADLISTASGFYIASLLRNSHFFMQDFYIKGLFLILVVLFATLLVRRSFTKVYVSYLDEMLDIFIAFLLAGIIFMSFTFVYKIGPVYSRLVIGFGFLFSFIIDVILRYVVRFILKKTNISRINALVIGGGKTGEFVIKSLKKQDLYPYNIVGILDDNKLLDDSVNGVKVIGKIKNLHDLLLKDNIDEVIFAITKYPVKMLTEIGRICDKFNVPINVIPNVFGLTLSGASIDEKEGVLLLRLNRNKITGLNAIVKRILDIIVASIALILLSPLFLVIAILIKINDPNGPVFFKHKRIGQYGKPFYCIKFRTMVNNADKVLEDLFKKHPSLREEFYRNFKLKDDPRVTRVGKILRKTSIDELPQVFNVLKGEMSIVGPRPIVEKELEKYSKCRDLLLEVKPGMAGLWVSNGRSDIGYEERVAMDTYYIKNWSVWMDVKIFIHSALSVIKRKGAY
jgi:Undecaprenyl-phosphate galactose phosphotransferase WbaP